MIMHSTSGLTDSRRRFLRYLALSPALASPLLMDGPLRKAFAWDRANSPPQASGSGAESIKGAEQVLDVMEFEELAHKALPPAHFAYLATGVDDDATVRLNHEAYQHIADSFETSD
jgi:4-hydroxymandelate oxidase